MNRQFIGTVCIRKGNKHQEPAAVYITGINGFDSLVCRVLNTGDIMFCDPNSEGEIIPFDFLTLQRLRAEWRLDSLKAQIPVLEQRITDEDY